MSPIAQRLGLPNIQCMMNSEEQKVQKSPLATSVQRQIPGGVSCLLVLSLFQVSYHISSYKTLPWLIPAREWLIIPALNISPQAIFEVLTITLCKYKYVQNYLHSSYKIFCFSRFLEFTLGAKGKIPHSFDVILLKSRKLLYLLVFNFQSLQI